VEDIEFEEALRFARSIRSGHIQIGPTIQLGPHIPKSGLSHPGDAASERPDPEPGAGQSSGLSEPQRAELRDWLQKLGPFRKGPFSFYGERVASHWNSDAKWQHCRPFLEKDPGVLEGDVLDLGCNNGYYLLRLLELKRSGGLYGLDPAPSFYRQFCFVQEMVRPDHAIAGIQVHMAGHEALRSGSAVSTDHNPPGSDNTPETDLSRTSGVAARAAGSNLNAVFPGQFDAILCWGVIYHRTDPIELLRTIHGALRTGGTLYLESMGIPEDDLARYPRALVPPGKYAGARGIWHVPDAATLSNYLHRSGFRDIEILKQWDYSAELNGETGLPALTDYLDPDRPGYLKDGLPAPIRILVRARR
tara:strand:- start:251143 stop:252225 length:1083 start_codon:yes stop_codon:yes gene_type:complete